MINPKIRQTLQNWSSGPKNGESAVCYPKR
jgi:hypothetical protein